MAAKIESILPDQQEGFVTPQQPTLAGERLSRKQRLAAAYRIFGRFRFDMGGAGHITVRDPEFPDHFWVNPYGVHFSKIHVSDLMRVDAAGQIVEPPKKVKPWLNKAAFAIHSALHRAHPEVTAAAHAHSLYGKAFSALGRLLAPINQDAAIFFERHALFGAYSGPIYDPAEGERLAAALGSANGEGGGEKNIGLILENHGLLTVGQSVESAIWRYLSMENACQTQLLAQGAGQPTPMAPEVARLTRYWIGDECASYCGFQPYWEWITAEEPDLLD